MRVLLRALIITNAALFFFGALQHAGLAIGQFHEPHILPASIVEALCGIALACGATALIARARTSWGVALTANAVAIAGVVLGMIALAAGRGPRTASNDLYHRIMLALSSVSLLILLFRRSALSRK